MQTRILHTKFWKDSLVASLTPIERLLFAYYLLNEYVNIIHCYELPDRTASFDTGATSAQIQAFKRKVEKAGPMAFYKDWVILRNADRYEKYEGEKNAIAKEKLLKSLPQDVIEWRVGVFSGLNDTPIDTPIHTDPIGSINHKSKIINKNTKIDDDNKHLLELYNTVFNKSLTSSVGFAENLQFWLEHHDWETIEKAIKVAKKSELWSKVMTPTILCRQKNPRGEKVDYIGDLAAFYKEPAKMTAYEESKETDNDPFKRTPEQQERLRRIVEEGKAMLAKKLQMGGSRADNQPPQVKSA